MYTCTCTYSTYTYTQYIHVVHVHVPKYVLPDMHVYSVLFCTVKPPIESRKKPVVKLPSKSGRGSYRHHSQQQQQQHGGGWGSEKRESVFTGPGNIYEVYSDPDKLKNDLALQPVV